MDKNLKFGIIGLGLIGGSIFKALCALKCNVYGVSKSKRTIDAAKKYCKNVSYSMDYIKDCDIIFICTPMNKILNILEELESILQPTAIVTDTASLKGFVCNKKRPYNFIPSHPMAGTENKGFSASYETLFQGAKWALTPFRGTNTKDIKTLKGIIEVLGAKPIITTPEKHDEAVALISHMPMLLAQALYKTTKDNALALSLASSGFRDMTRLALSNEEMANDMINMNSQNIQKSFCKLCASVGDLIKNDYPDQIKNIKKQRKKMYVDGINKLK